jgi:hypothetical protein
LRAAGPAGRVPRTAELGRQTALGNSEVLKRFGPSKVWQLYIFQPQGPDLAYVVIRCLFYLVGGTLEIMELQALFIDSPRKSNKLQYFDD